MKRQNQSTSKGRIVPKGNRPSITKSPFNNFLSRVVKCRPHVVQGKMEMGAVKAVPVAGRGFTDFHGLVVDVEQESGERATVV